MDYINIKIGNERYIQRTEYSKIVIINDNGSKYSINNLNELPPFQQLIINTLLDVEKSPRKYFNYEEYNGEIFIMEYYGNLKHLVIPREIDGKKVTELGSIFCENETLETIIFPDTIKNISRNICYDMRNLKFVQLSTNIKNIPPLAFFNCNHLKYINLENLEKIENYGFNNCDELETINLEKIKSIEVNAFAECKKLKTINIPNIEKLAESAFSYCENIEEVALGNKLSVINRYSFCGCKNLSKIDFPNNLLEINNSAFYNCPNLKQINFPNTLIKIGDYAFADTNVPEIIFPETLTHIGKCAFAKQDIKNIKISKDTKYEEDTFFISSKEIEKER